MTVPHLLLGLILVCAVGFWFLVDAVNSGVNDILGRFISAEQMQRDAFDAIDERLGAIAVHAETAANSASLIEDRGRPFDPDD